MNSAGILTLDDIWNGMPIGNKRYCTGKDPVHLINKTRIGKWAIGHEWSDGSVTLWWVDGAGVVVGSSLPEPVKPVVAEDYEWKPRVEGNDF